jgi:hypothetical protein
MVAYRRYVEPNERAFTMLVPDGWQADGRISYPLGGLQVSFQGFSPDKTKAIFFEKPRPIVYQHPFFFGQQGSWHVPGVSMYYPFRTTDQYISEILMPEYRQVFGQDLKLVNRINLTNSPASSAGMYLFTFTRSGINFALFAALGTSGMAIPSGAIATWTAMIDGIVAPRSEFEGFFQTGWNSLASLQANPRFVGNYENMARENKVAPVRTALAGLSDLFFDSLHSGQQSEARLDSKFQAYSEATLGAHDEVDDTGNSYYVPNHHEYWFYDASTGKLAGNDTGENPDPSRNFKPLRRPNR